ncbi:MAG: hypothetical protein V1672_02470 [Candidatus Diapherotrites archaeon]
MKKILFIALIVLIFFVPLTHAAPITSPIESWTATYNTGTEFREKAYDVATDSEGNVIIAGTIGYPINSTSHYKGFIVKYSPQGEKLWQYTDDQECWNPYVGVTLDSKDNIIFGRTLVVGFGGAGTQITEFDGEGGIIWSKSYGTAYLKSVGVDSQDNIIILYGSSAYRLSKYDSGGGIIWEKTGKEEASKVAVDSQDNIVITTCRKKIMDYKVLTVIKYDSGGAEAWKIDGPYLGSGSCSYMGVAVDSGDNILIATGRSLFRYSPAGKGKGSMNYLSNWHGLYAKDLIIDSADNVIITHYLQYFTSGDNIFDIFTLALNPDWTYKWAAVSGGIINKESHAIATDSEDNVIVAGEIGYENVKPLQINAFVVKYTENVPGGPVFIKPTPGLLYDYKLCDNLLFRWLPGPESTGTYYISAKLDGEQAVTDFEIKGTQLPLDYKWVETEADDGIWEYWVCNGKNNYQCTEHRFITKDTTPELEQPIEQTVTTGYAFKWSAIENAKRYVIKMTGLIGPKEWTVDNPLYFSLMSSNSHILTPVEYKALKGTEFTWSVSATCNTLPDVKYMSKLDYSEPEVFYK